MTKSSAMTPLLPSMGPPVRDHRNAVRNQSESLAAFNRNGWPHSSESARKTYSASFVKLDAARQDEVIMALEHNKATEFTWPSAPAFFNTLRTHTMEGMFADPIYGGNKDFAGWRLVGFPGAHPAFTPADMQSKEAFAGGALIGLQAQAPTRRT